MTKENDGIDLTVKWGEHPADSVMDTNEPTRSLQIDGTISNPKIVAAIRAASADPDGDPSDGMDVVLKRGLDEISKLKTIVPEGFADGCSPLALYEIVANFGDERAPRVYGMLRQRFDPKHLTATTVRTVIAALDQDVDVFNAKGFLWKQ